MKNKISIIVPVYNVEKYISECINSILIQTYANFELIIVDDGSTDNSIDRIEREIKLDGRIKLVHKTNGGLSSARNFGLQYVTGEYIVFVDSDDSLKKDFLDVMINSIGDADICSCGYNEVSENNIHIQSRYNRIDMYTQNQNVDDYSAAIECIDLIPNAWGKIYKKDVFSAIRYPEGVLFEDFAVAYKIFFQRKAVFVNQALYNYRIRSGSIMRSFNPKIVTDKIYILNELRSFLERHNYNLYINNYINAYLYHGVFVTSCIIINETKNNESELLKKFIVSDIDLSIFNVRNIVHSKSLSLKIKCYLLLLMFSPKATFFLKKKITKYMLRA